jgi:hypothetical protein
MQLLTNHSLRMTLKFVHLLAVCIWTGGGMTVLVLLYDDRQACSSSELSAFNLAIRSIDDYLIKPAAAGTLVSGTLLCLLGNWGLMRHRWIIAKWTITLAAIAFGAVCLGPWFRELAIVSGGDNPAVYGESGYQRLYRLGVLFGTLQTAVLLFLVLISIVKPDFRPGRNTAADKKKPASCGSTEEAGQEPAGSSGRRVTRKVVPAATSLSTLMSPP